MVPVSPYEATARAVAWLILGSVLLTGCSRLAVADNAYARQVPVSLVRSLSCHFKTISAANIDDDWFRRRGSGDKWNVMFSDFDWNKGTAAMSGSGGTSTVQARKELYLGDVVMTFVERTDSGNLTLTSVFFSSPVQDIDTADPLVKAGEATAAHSRHLSSGSVGRINASISQSVGTCEIVRG
jgi:hypothetical protein